VSDVRSFRPDPAQRARLEEVRDNLIVRIAEANAKAGSARSKGGRSTCLAPQSADASSRPAARLLDQDETAWPQAPRTVYAPSMRTVFIFPSGEMAAATATLDRLFDGQAGDWTDGKLYINLENERDGLLFTDWEPDDVRRLEAALGSRPSWAVQVDISGRIDGTAEIRDLVSCLLQDGGVAVDDYSDHCWTLCEIETDLKVDGLGFFDFRTHYLRTRVQ
jgi:hypothetical protein